MSGVFAIHEAYTSTLAYKNARMFVSQTCMCKRERVCFCARECMCDVPFLSESACLAAAAGRVVV